MSKQRKFLLLISLVFVVPAVLSDGDICRMVIPRCLHTCGTCSYMAACDMRLKSKKPPTRHT
ncbi:hypothetical protein K469DRAFT_704240 [Zopfia rhizophila CBS 207.26]|uniref:Uncharacterized protein n=1 Tax=Zopfia rhizophila CBS 207.26 TaxID=1314779 RepID=A0A6A6EBP7_9PEZI|nr:hypothetical protein K469DRAFT_704240 [Zopfia rhizophila CBS 207.26]